MKLKLSYQTQHLPAPYAFSAVFDVELDKTLNIAFMLTYLDREELSEEEILSEGYSLEDDFSWHGTLGTHWKDPIKVLLTTARSKEPQDSFFLHIANEGAEWFPAVADDVLVHELLQAVLEAAEREAPLSIYFTDSKQEHIHLVWKFAERQTYLDSRAVSWDGAQEVMKLVYALDFETMKPSKERKVNSISFDGAAWYSVQSPQLWTTLGALLQG